MAVKSTAHTATHTRTGYNSIQLLTNLLDLKKMHVEEELVHCQKGIGSR